GAGPGAGGSGGRGRLSHGVLAPAGGGGGDGRDHRGRSARRGGRSGGQGGGVDAPIKLGSPATPLNTPPPQGGLAMRQLRTIAILALAASAAPSFAQEPEVRSYQAPCNPAQIAQMAQVNPPPGAECIITAQTNIPPDELAKLFYNQGNLLDA